MAMYSFTKLSQKTVKGECVTHSKLPPLPLITLVLLTSIFFLSSTFAAEKKGRVHVPALNETLLSNYRVTQKELSNFPLFDQNTCSEWRPQFENAYLQQDRRERYGAQTSIERRQFMENEKSHSKNAMDALARATLRNSLKSTLKKYRKKALEWVGNMRDPLAATFFVASAVTGGEIKVKATKWMTVKSRTKIQHKTTQLALDTPLVETVVAYQKPGSNQKISTALSARIDQNWTAGLDSSNKGTVRLQYQVSF